MPILKIKRRTYNLNKWGLEKILNTGKKLQDLSENRAWLTFLVLVTIGTMIIFFLGCGSGSAPDSKKAEKTAKSSGAIKSQSVTPLLVDKEGTISKEMRKAVNTVGPQPREMFPGVTQEEIEARHEVERKKVQAPGNEIIPGFTNEQLEARHEVERKKVQAPGNEIIPGFTNEQLEARMEADQQKHDPRQMMEQWGQLLKYKTTGKEVKPENRKMVTPAVGK